jgi:two-component system, NtrC family, sensor kinase
MSSNIGKGLLKSSSSYAFCSVANLLSCAYLGPVMRSAIKKVRATLVRGLLPPSSTWSEELLRPLPSIVGRNQLLDYLGATLAELLDIATVYVLLHEPITGRFSCRRGFGADPEQNSKLQFHEDAGIIQWLRANGTPLDLSVQEDILRSFPVDEQDLLTGARICLVIPLMAVNRFSGLVLAGPRTRGGPFTTSDLDALARLAGNAALAIEHALILDQQESQLKKMLHADKLATVGQLASGAAHEIRNPLATIRSGMEYLGRYIPAGEQYLVTTVLAEATRIDGIIKGLLSLSKSTGVNLVKLDLADLLRHVLNILDPELRKNRIETTVREGGTGTWIEVDPSQIKQVLLNVLLNAIQAMPDGGALQVAFTEFRGNGRERNMLIQITDTGAGIASDDLPRVFDPFFTKKESGTGLGLSICYGIVARHGGDITIDSRTEGASHGTTVSIYLPAGRH